MPPCRAVRLEENFCGAETVLDAEAAPEDTPGLPALFAMGLRASCIPRSTGSKSEKSGRDCGSAPQDLVIMSAYSRGISGGIGGRSFLTVTRDVICSRLQSDQGSLLVYISHTVQ